MKKQKIKKPWGEFERFTLNEISTVKILKISPGKRTSLQRHKKRSEFWKVIDNPVRVSLGNKTKRLKAGDEIKIPKGKKHRIEGLKKPARILEISFGNFDEKDIERFEDDFGRL